MDTNNEQTIFKNSVMSEGFTDMIRGRGNPGSSCALKTEGPGSGDHRRLKTLPLPCTLIVLDARKICRECNVLETPCAINISVYTLAM